MDNGGGMTPDTLHKMLGFGHSDKKEIDGHRSAHGTAYGVLEHIVSRKLTTV